jgi:hypothetical protein
MTYPSGSSDPERPQPNSMGQTEPIHTYLPPADSYPTMPGGYNPAGNSADAAPSAPMDRPPVSGPPSSPTQAWGSPYPEWSPSTPPPGVSAAGPQPSRKRGLAVPILAALTVLLLIVASALTTLYVSKNSELGRAKHTISQRESDLSAKNAELEKVQRDYEKAKTDLGGSQSQTEELTHEKQVISKCLNLLAEGGLAAQKGDRATATKKQNEAEPVCREADRYLE